MLQIIRRNSGTQLVNESTFFKVRVEKGRKTDVSRMFPLLIEVNIYASYSVGLVFGVPASSQRQYWPFVLHC